MHFTTKQRTSAKNAIHEKSCKSKTDETNTTLPSPNCCPHLPMLWQLKHRNTIIWQFNIITSDIWKDYANLGMNRMAKPIAWSVGQRNFQPKHFAKRHPITSLSAQRQSYLGETIGQMDQHEHCPLCLQGIEKNGRGLTTPKPVSGKNICFQILLGRYKPWLQAYPRQDSLQNQGPSHFITGHLFTKWGGASFFFHVFSIHKKTGQKRRSKSTSLLP